MAVKDRLGSELAFHDHQARQRAAEFARRPGELRFEDGTYLDHETWIRPAFRQLDLVKGARVLDYGCGHGMAAVVLARRNTRVTAFDLSSDYLREVRARSRANHVSVDVAQADGERLPFPDGSFDRIWGNAVLHHLDLHTAGRELHRVLRPGGIAVFCEPWGENPVLNWARKSLPYPGKGRTPDERPLRLREARILETIFPGFELSGFQLFSMVRRAVRTRWLISGLDACDAFLLPRVPFLKRFCRYVVITLRR